MTKIDLITGILGAGKTTFLLKYARALLDRGENIAILENDFGAVNADMVLLQELRSDRCKLEMISGGGDAHCHRRRFRTQLIALGMEHPDRVIVEPSGIYDMDEFFDIIHEPPLDRWFEIGSILTVINAETETDLTDEMEYLLASEAACAGKLILSKLPAQSPETCAEALLGRLNQALTAIRCDRQFTAADMLCKDWNTLTADDFSALTAAGYRNASYVKKYAVDTLRSGVHYFMHIRLPETQIGEILQGIFADADCGKIYRIKGSLPDENGGWFSINAMPEKIEMRPVLNAQAVLIVIGDGLSLDALNAHFRQHNTDPKFVSI